MKDFWSLKDGEGWVFDLVDTLVCIVFTPLVIIRHLWHLWCAILSTLAVLLASIINVIMGTEYQQFVEFYYADPTHSYYEDLPDWYVWLCADANNYITTFHKWLVGFVSYDIGGGDDDDDDWHGGEPQEIDEHEALNNPV
ncbi:TMhelix containing protein [Vibrio phage 3.058.O._10N.286.46.B8]|nr:TMhelix containing protein [Vibrio phage 3.058.O._10N.286.46.B8]